MIITLGAFDGFHSGHQKLFNAARRIANENRTDWGVVTFEPHPKVFIGKLKAVMFEPREREVLRRVLGVPHLINIKFDDDLRNLPALEFLERLNNYIRIDGVVVGNNFRFGRRQEGGLDILKNFCVEHGAGLWVVQVDFFSSAKVRRQVAHGVTNQMFFELGYPWFLWTKVIKGSQRGRELGYRTANLDIKDRKLFPAEAVYAAAVPIFDNDNKNAEWHAACVSVGYNPTFKDVKDLRAEVYIMDFNQDLYDKDIQVFFLNKLRKMKEFENKDELIEQIAVDVKRSRRFFNLAFKFDERKDLFARFADAISSLSGKDFKPEIIDLLN